MELAYLFGGGKLKQLVNPEYKIRTIAKFSADSKHRYVLTYDWSNDGPESSVMVVTNYPGESDGVTMDLTTSLIINNVRELGFNKVVMVNLFSKMGLVHGDQRLLKDGITASTNMVTLIEANNVEQIIMATGSFPQNNKIAFIRQNELIEQLKKAGFGNKINFLVDCDGKRVHPLASIIRKKWILKAI